MDNKQFLKDFLQNDHDLAHLRLCQCISAKSDSNHYPAIRIRKTCHYHEHYISGIGDISQFKHSVNHL